MIPSLTFSNPHLLYSGNFSNPLFIKPPLQHTNTNTYTHTYTCLGLKSNFYDIFCHFLSFFIRVFIYLLKSRLYEFAKNFVINLVWTVVLPFFVYCSSSFRIPEAYLRHCHTSMNVFFGKNSYFPKKSSSQLFVWVLNPYLLSKHPNTATNQ